MKDDNMLQTGLNYELLVEDALRSVVRTSLGIVQKVGLPGETHFFISFSTTHPGVEIDKDLRTKHPENMTIVIQHQFSDLEVGNEDFCITLFFNGKPSSMVIPFQAVTSFNDPSVGFGLQFGIDDEDENKDEERSNIEESKEDNAGSSKLNKRPDKRSKVAKESGADVVVLDKFRKKPND